MNPWNYKDCIKFLLVAEALKKTLSKYVTTESDSFRVKHFAGEVNYQTRDMYMRNRDYLPEELIETLRESSDERMVAVFTNKMTKTGHVITTDAGPPPKAYEKVKSKVGIHIYYIHDRLKDRSSTFTHYTRMKPT